MCCAQEGPKLPFSSVTQCHTWAHAERRRKKIPVVCPETGMFGLHFVQCCIEQHFNQITA